MSRGRTAICGQDDGLPELHVRLDVQELLEIDAPWLPGCGLEHEPTKLGVEDGEGILFPV